MSLWSPGLEERAQEAALVMISYFDAPEGAHRSEPQGWGGSPGLSFSALSLFHL